MKKFILSIIMVALWGGGAWAATNYDFSATCSSGQTLYYKITSNTEPYTVQITYQRAGNSSNNNTYYVTPPTGDLVIPSSVTNSSTGITYSVTSIGISAFYGCSGLTSVFIPNSVTSIGSAFNYCTGLTSVTIPNSITSISGFGYCRGLTSITIPESVTGISGSAFVGCSGLTEITIPNSVTSIGSQAFYGCSGLTEITIPNSVTSIDFGAFGDCSGLTAVNFNAAYCTTMGNYNSPVFRGCDSFTTLNIGENVRNIPSYAFRNCSALTTINLNATNCTSFGSDNGLSGNTNISRLNIGENVVRISGFNDCSGLTEVYYAGSMDQWCRIIFNQPLSNAHNLYINNNLVTDLVVPETVTEIIGYTFYGATCLTSVTFHNSITSIGESAFSGCTGLSSVEIPNSTTSIGESAFSGCNGLASITIPNSVTSISSGVFSGCSGLTSFTIPNSVTSIGESAFSGCSGLTSITIPNSVTSISSGVFSGCSGLTSLTISNSISTIGEYAFSGCSGLTSVTIPNSISTIGEYAFSACSGLTSVTIPNSVTSIGRSAFYNCSGLTSVTIPNTVTNIGNNAFSGCIRLTVTIPNSVTSIGSNAFYVVPSIVYYGTATGSPWGALSLNCYYEDGFYYTSMAKDTLVTAIRTITNANIPNSVIRINSNALRYCSDLVSLTLGSSVSSIGMNAFYDCNGLTSVTFGNSVTYVGSNAFYGCDNLISVSYTGNIEQWCGIEFYDAHANPLYKSHNLYINDDFVTDLVIPNTVTEIKKYAFIGASCLVSATIPNSVTRIGNYAFSGCSGLTGSLTIPNSITSISQGTFYGCTGLSGALVIPDLVTNIGGSAFSGCSGLTSVTIPNSVTSIYGGAFQDCTGLSRVNYTGNIEQWCRITFADHLANPIGQSHNLYFDNELVTNLFVPETITEIKNYVFFGDTCLTSVTIPNSITRIGRNAFTGCVGLSSVILPNSVTTIEEGAFSRCSGLISVIIPSSVTRISSFVFNGCSRLESITIPFVGENANVTPTSNYQYPFGYIFGTTSYDDRDTAITQYYYYSNSIIRNINYYIPTSLRSVIVSGGYVPYGAFSNCNMLTSITLGESVTAIGGSAFLGCTNLNSLEIGGSVEDMGESALSGCTLLTQMVSRALNPPTIYSSTFEDLDISSVSVYVPCGRTSTYRATEYWNSFENIFEAPTFTIMLTSNDANMGEATIIQEATCDNMTVIISATPSEHHHFLQWSDGDTNNPRTITIIGNVTYTAEFAIDQHTIMVESGNETMGTVSEGGIYDYGTELLISATANEGYRFISWADGNIDNPRRIIVTGNAVFTANFEALPQYVITVNSTNNTQGFVLGGGSFYEGVEISILAIPTEHYHFVKWNDENTDNPRTIIVSEDATYTAEFAIDQHSITIVSDDEIMGTVSDGGTYDYGTEIQISAIPTEHHHFVRWGDGDTDNPRIITVIEDATYTAEFAVDQYSIMVVSSDETMGSVSDGGTYDYGTEIQIFAIPSEHYHFLQWSDENIDNPRTVIVTENTTYTAEFAIDQHTITVASADETIGTVSGGGTYDYGTEIQILAMSVEHYHFVRWTDGNTDNPRIIIVTDNVTYTAEFAGDTFAIIVETPDETMGTTSGNGTYDYGSEIQISATPANHYHFVQWTDGNTDNPRTITVTEDATFTAEFAIDQHTITVESVNAEMGIVSESGTYDYGTEIQISATANDGYRFTVWNDGDTNNPRTIIVTQDSTFTANFIALHNITVLSADEEMGTTTGTGVYDENSEIQISAIPADHYHFVQWTDGNTDNPRTITVVEDTIFTAEFAIDQHTITVESADTEMGTVSEGGTYDYGTEIQISASARDGYQFASWNDDNTDNPRYITVTSDATYIASFIPAVGIDESIATEITLFPNPVNDILNITSSETISEIEIVNVMGQVVKRMDVNSDNAACNVEDLRSGVYVVRIHAASATLSQWRFVKE